MNKINHDVVVAAFLIVASMVTRLIPHVDNFSPIEAAVLFGSAYFYRKIWAFLLPLASMYTVDLVINNTFARPFFPDIQGIVWYSDYMMYNAIAYLFIALAGTIILKKINTFRVLTGAVITSVIFYLITNFGAWADPRSMYSHDLNGLGLSYLAGIPFFRTSLLATLIFSMLFFILFEKLSILVFKSKAIAR